MINHILPATNLLLIVTISIVAIHNFSYLNRHRNDKNKLKNQVSDLYPLVDPDFYNQPLAQQTVENNQEIQEINEKLARLTKIIEELQKHE